MLVNILYFFQKNELNHGFYYLQIINVSLVLINNKNNIFLVILYSFYNQVDLILVYIVIKLRDISRIFVEIIMFCFCMVVLNGIIMSFMGNLYLYLVYFLFLKFIINLKLLVNY